jgi:hypothetical protein
MCPCIFRDASIPIHTPGKCPACRETWLRARFFRIPTVFDRGWIFFGRSRHGAEVKHDHRFPNLPLDTPMIPTLKTAIILGTLLPGALAAATVVNIDFGRDTTGTTTAAGGGNPGGNVDHILYTGTGPAPDSGTVWNDGQVRLTTASDTIPQPLLFQDLVSSIGGSTGVDIELTSGFYRSFNGTATPAANTVAALQNDRIFANLGNTATLTIKGLNPTYTYDVYLINSAFSTRYTIGASSKVSVGTAYDGTWTDTEEYASFAGLNPSGIGEIAIQIRDSANIANGTLSGIQIVEVVPEPSSAMMLLLPLAGFAFQRRR